ncbi:HEAT repeat domain-containing protein [Rudaea sp.]|uniref:HEAT repeat domain-containing protein n=1 Tax=Rudaea sp. TaxID=2136325 RepID=UPI003784F56E
MASESVDPPRKYELDGRPLSVDDPRIAHFANLIRSQSKSLAEYVGYLKEMVEDDEFRHLAERLLDQECDYVAGKGIPMVRSENQIVLCRDSIKTLLINDPAEFQSSPKEPGPIVALANDAAFLVLGEARVKVVHYSIVESEDQPNQLKRVIQRDYGRNDLWAVNAENGVSEITSIDGDGWILQLVLGDHLPVIRYFDRSSLYQIGTSSANVHASRIEFILDLFKRFRYQEAAAAVEKIQNTSRFHFVRWKAVQTLLNLDLERGKSSLARALNDPHPHVRRAASRTLANLVSHSII